MTGDRIELPEPNDWGLSPIRSAELAAKNGRILISRGITPDFYIEGIVVSSIIDVVGATEMYREILGNQEAPPSIRNLVYVHQANLVARSKWQLKRDELPKSVKDPLLEAHTFSAIPWVKVEDLDQTMEAWRRTTAEVYKDPRLVGRMGYFFDRLTTVATLIGWV